MSAQQERIARSLKRLGFQLEKGRGKAFKITASGGSTAPNSTDTMTLTRSSAGSAITSSRNGRGTHRAPRPSSNARQSNPR